MQNISLRANDQNKLQYTRVIPDSIKSKVP